MKTRIIQREPKPEQPDASAGDATQPPPAPAHNLAARMARWSGQHRKKAIFGWLAFALIAFAVGMNVVGQKDISDVDGVLGGVRPCGAGAGPRRPEADRGGRLHPERQAHRQGPGVPGGGRRRHRPHVPDPLRPEREVAAGTAAAPSRPTATPRWCNFDIAGDSTEAADRVDPTLAAVAAVQKRHPGLDIEQFGDASAEQGDRRGHHRRPREGGDALAAGHADHPHHHLRDARGGGSAAADRAHLRDGRARAWSRITSQLFPVDSNLPAVVLLIGLAVGVDYSLFYLRREREERAAGRERARRAARPPPRRRGAPC